MYLFRENKVPSNATFTSGNFIGITNITSPTAIGTSDPGTWTIPAGNGILFFFRGNASSYATRTASPYIAPENTTLTATGNLNQQSVAVYDWFTPNSANLSYTSATANTAVRGFNMVGNPYACSIDWNSAFSGTGITRTNINPTIYVFNPVTNQYDSYMTTSSSTGVSNGGGTDGSGNATNIIASGQGFFVQANNGGAPVLTFTENAKAPTSQVTGSSLLMGSPAGQNVVQQLMRLRLGIDSLNYDYIAIAFNSSASPNFNREEDAQYLPGLGAMVGLSSLSADGKNLAINSLPLPTLKQQVIKLDVEAANTGTYTLQRTTLNAIPQIYDIWLMDNYKKDSLDIRNNTTYTFNIDKTDPASFGVNRFSIVLRQNPALGVHLLNFIANKVTDGAQNIWVTENEQNYTNFTVERSIDNGATFTVVGGMPSSAQGTYSFVDKNPQSGTDQYRLKLVDLNGTVTYSKVVTLLYSDLSNNIVGSNISIYPNPSSGIINLAIARNGVASASTLTNASTLKAFTSTPTLVSLPVSTTASYSIKMVSITGSVVKTATSSSANWQDNVSSLVPGTYIIQVINNTDNSVVGKSTFIKL
jgi:hypothetical protein